MSLLLTVMFYLQVPTTPRHMPRKYSLLPNSDLEKRFDSLESLRCSSPGDSYVGFRYFEGFMKQGSYDVLTNIVICFIYLLQILHLLKTQYEMNRFI